MRRLWILPRPLIGWFDVTVVVVVVVAFSSSVTTADDARVVVRYVRSINSNQ